MLAGVNAVKVGLPDHAGMNVRAPAFRRPAVHRGDAVAPGRAARGGGAPLRRLRKKILSGLQTPGPPPSVRRTSSAPSRAARRAARARPSPSSRSTSSTHTRSRGCWRSPQARAAAFPPPRVPAQGTSAGTRGQRRRASDRAPSAPSGGAASSRDGATATLVDLSKLKETSGFERAFLCGALALSELALPELPPKAFAEFVICLNRQRAQAARPSPPPLAAPPPGPRVTRVGRRVGTCFPPWAPLARRALHACPGARRGAGDQESERHRHGARSPPLLPPSPLPARASPREPGPQESALTRTWDSPVPSDPRPRGCRWASAPRRPPPSPRPR